MGKIQRGNDEIYSVCIQYQLDCAYQNYFKIYLAYRTRIGHSFIVLLQVHTGHEVKIFVFNILKFKYMTNY